MLAKKHRLSLLFFKQKPERLSFYRIVPSFSVSIHSSDLQHSRFAIIVPKKNIEKAHDRNRIKRTIYTLIQENNLHKAPKKDILVYVNKTPDELEYQKLITNLLK